MVVDQVNAWWWFKLNGLVRHAAVRAVPGFGPPKIVLTEHPKSGGTWIGQMLAAYLGVPHPRNRLPPRSRCVLQGHYLHTAPANDTVVVWRDGRDVMVSYYYYALLDPLTRPAWRAGHRQRLGIKDIHDVHRYLPRFIEYCFADGPPANMTWTSFAGAWQGRDGCVQTSYEAMKADPAQELTRILRYLSVGEVDQARLDACIAQFSFEKMVGRKPGEEVAGSFLRKGIVGDWKSKFTREARAVFDHHAGQTLIDLGYETDRSWTDADA